MIRKSLLRVAVLAAFAIVALTVGASTTTSVNDQPSFLGSFETFAPEAFTTASGVCIATNEVFRACMDECLANGVSPRLCVTQCLFVPCDD